MNAMRPLNDIRSLLARIPARDEVRAARVRDQFASLPKPPGSLGRLEEIAEWLAAWSARPPAVTRPLVAIFAGDHGLAASADRARDLAETKAEIERTASGTAAINQLCLAGDLGLKVFELALDHPTAGSDDAPTMDERDCAATMAFGMEAIAGGVDLICVGTMGSGGAMAAAALAAALFGGKGVDWADAGAEGQVERIERVLAHHQDHLSDPLEALRRIGGREFAAVAGCILAARMEKIPVIIDGYGATAAASVLYRLNPRALDHCMLGHAPREPGHARLVSRLPVRPLLDLDISHGQACGAALAAGLVKSAALCHAGMVASLPSP